MASKRILVIGAGMAGLSCARELHDAGHHVEVVDKARGPGGRMSTRRGDALQFDHGAQYFTARDAAFARQVTTWQREGCVKPWQPRLAVLGGDGGHRDPESVIRYVGTPGMSAILGHMATDLALRCNCRVSALRCDSSGWQLRSESEGWHAAVYDAVVLALPAPQAQTLLADHSAGLARLAASALMAPCWALMLHYEQAPVLPFDAAFVNTGALAWLARDSSKPQRAVTGECWVIHASEAWSEENLGLSEAAAASALLQHWQNLLRPLVAALPDPRQWQAHRWLYARAHGGAGSLFALDQHKQLGLCGDWLPGARVEGAWRSGRALAQALLA